MNKHARRIAGALGLCGAVLLGGCAAPGAYGDYGYGASSYGGYPQYSQPYYGSAPVVVPSPVYIQGGYYDSPGHYGRPGYYNRPGYVAPPAYASRPGYGGGYDGRRPGRPDQGYQQSNRPGAQPGGGMRPGRGNPTPQQLAPGIHPNLSPNDPSLPIESQRILRERAQGGGGS